MVTMFQDEIETILNIVTLSKMSDLNDTLILKNIGIDYTKYFSMNYNDLIKENLPNKLIKNWGWWLQSRFSIRRINEDIYKTPHGHEWDTKTTNIKKIYFFYGLNQAIYYENKSKKVRELTLDIKDISSLHIILYYVDSITTNNYLDLNYLHGLKDHKSSFVMTSKHIKSNTGRKFIYHYGGKYRYSRTDEVLKCRLSEIKEKRHKDRFSSKIEVDDIKVMYGNAKLHTFNHLLSATSYNCPESEIRIFGVRLKDLLNSKFINAFRTNRYLDIKLEFEDVNELFNIQNVEMNVLGKFNTIINESRIGFLFDKKDKIFDSFKDSVLFNIYHPDFFKENKSERAHIDKTYAEAVIDPSREFISEIEKRTLKEIASDYEEKELIERTSIKEMDTSTTFDDQFEPNLNISENQLAEIPIDNPEIIEEYIETTTTPSTPSLGGEWDFDMSDVFGSDSEEEEEVLIEEDLKISKRKITKNQLFLYSTQGMQSYDFLNTEDLDLEKHFYNIEMLNIRNFMDTIIKKDLIGETYSVGDSQDTFCMLWRRISEYKKSDIKEIFLIEKQIEIFMRQEIATFFLIDTEPSIDDLMTFLKIKKIEVTKAPIQGFVKRRK